MFMTVLANATHLVETLPLPAFVLTRDWTLHATNAHFRTLMQLPPIEHLPEAQCTAMHLVFDPHLPVRERITVTPHMWAMHAHTALSRFRNDHVLMQREPWYKERIAAWSGLPDFADYWNRTAETPVVSGPLAMIAPLHDRPIRYHQAHLALGTTPYPAIAMLVPADDASRAVLTHLGCTPAQYYPHEL